MDIESHCAALSMPELPEVEIVARRLDKLVIGRRIAEVELLRPRLAPDTKPCDFAVALAGSKINCVHRRGKYILFDPDNDRTLIVHLRMSGRFLLIPGSKENLKFTHAVFHFGDGDRLIFQDQRHFGFMKVVETVELQNTHELKKLAPEPFSSDFSTEYLRTALRKSKRSLKEFLVDQTRVCGLGNIYASEALFLAGVHPEKRAHRLSRAKVPILFGKIRQILAEAIEAGSTFNVDPENIESSYYANSYESIWRVYDREKMPCVVCGSLILRLKQNGRSTYFCPTCQKK